MSVLAVDIGGNNIRAAFFKNIDDWDKSKIFSTSTHEISEKPLDPLRLISFLEQLINTHSKVEKLEAIGFSIAGVTDTQKGVVRRALNIGWSNLPIRSIIEEKFNIPVSIDSDTFCGGEAELQGGLGKKEDTFLYLAIGTGIGHCLIINNHIWRGLHKAANIFGHLKTGVDGPDCYCGGKGCVCQYSSGEGIKRLGQKFSPKGELIKSGKEVVTAANDNFEWAQNALSLSTEYLALSISHVYTILDIECVVLSGGAVSNLWPDLEELTKLVEKFLFPEVRPIRLYRSKFGDKSNIVGAAYNAFNIIY